MKTALQKISVSVVLVILSLLACIIGMYLLFKTQMDVRYQIACSFVFMLNFVFAFIAAFLQFKMAPKKEPKAEKEAKDAPVAEEVQDDTIDELLSAPSATTAGMNFDPDTGEPLHGGVETGDAKLSDDPTV